MSGVWMSSLASNYDIGFKDGLRTKFFDEGWEPASFEIPILSDTMSANAKRSARGYAMQRNEMPEAAAIWNEKSFKKIREIFISGAFYVVREKLAAILSRFDLGEGGLVPFPIYKADLVTPYGGEFFLINFGARKNTVLIEQSENVVKFAVDYKTGIQYWKVNHRVEDEQVVLSSASVKGADIWVEEVVYNKIFMSEALASALQDAGLAEDWMLQRCRVMEAGQ